MEIRERRDEDLDELVKVAARVHAADQYPIFMPDGDLSRFVQNPEPLAAWVAVRAERIVGHVALNVETSLPVMRLVAGLMQGDGAAVYIARLLVDSDARRAGVGGALLEHARLTAVNRGQAPFLDVVDTPAAAPAISLYRLGGWEEVGRVGFELDGGHLDELVFRGPSCMMSR